MFYIQTAGRKRTMRAAATANALSSIWPTDYPAKPQKMLSKAINKLRHQLKNPAATSDVQIVIGTRDSAGWIEVLLAEYHRLAIEPLVLLDGSSQDATEKILCRRGIRYQKVFPQFPRIEAIIQEIPRHTDARWVLRLDDDEFPSLRLVSWLKQNLANTATPVIGVPRRWLRLGNSEHCEYSSHPLLRWLDDRMDIQWRLFQPDQVDYLTDIHSAGFRVESYDLVPEEAYLVHFDWILRSYEQRLSKIKKYDEQKPGAGTNFRDLYLWETSDRTLHQFMPMETLEFDRLAAQLKNLALPLNK